MNGYFLVSLPSSFKYFSLLSGEIPQQKVIKMTNNLCKSFSTNNERFSTLPMKWFFRLPIVLLHLDFRVIAGHSFSDIVEHRNDAIQSTDEEKLNNVSVSFMILMDLCFEYHLVSCRATNLSDTFLMKVLWRLYALELQNAHKQHF